MFSLLCFLPRRSEKKHTIWFRGCTRNTITIQYLKRIINESKQFLGFYCLPGPVLDMGDVKMHKKKKILHPPWKYFSGWDSSNIIAISRKGHIMPASTTSSSTTYWLCCLWVRYGSCMPQFPHLYNGVLTSCHSEQCLERSRCYKSLSSRDDLILA